MEVGNRMNCVSMLSCVPLVSEAYGGGAHYALTENLRIEIARSHQATKCVHVQCVQSGVVATQKTTRRPHESQSIVARRERELLSARACIHTSFMSIYVICHMR